MRCAVHTYPTHWALFARATRMPDLARVGAVSVHDVPCSIAARHRLEEAACVPQQPDVASRFAACTLPAAGLSRVRLLLRDMLAPMSSLFHYLAMWSSQDDIASHRLLLRLLE